MTEEPKNGTESPPLQEPLDLAGQIVPMPVAFFPPCSCGEKLAINDAQAVQALAAGQTGQVRCPTCDRPLNLSLSRILIAPNRAEKRAQEAAGKKPGLVRIK